MTAKDGQYRFIDPALPPPAPEVCERIATNQLGVAAFFATPLNQDETWRGNSSGETGVHQQYELELVEDHGDENYNVYQQWIIMKQVSGSFTAGEELQEATP